MPPPPEDEDDDHTHSTGDHTHSTGDHTHYDLVPQEPVTIAESLDKLFTSHKTTPTPPVITPTRQVLYDFKSQNTTELTVCEGERVSLLSLTDPEGNSEWCLVMNTTTGEQGYVPRDYLSCS